MENRATWPKAGDVVYMYNPDSVKVEKGIVIQDADFGRHVEFEGDRQDEWFENSCFYGDDQIFGLEWRHAINLHVNSIDAKRREMIRQANAMYDELTRPALDLSLNGEQTK